MKRLLANNFKVNSWIKLKSKLDFVKIDDAKILNYFKYMIRQKYNFLFYT
jgi:hypothetical protein